MQQYAIVFSFDTVPSGSIVDACRSSSGRLQFEVFVDSTRSCRAPETEFPPQWLHLINRIAGTAVSFLAMLIAVPSFRQIR
jgi:hypothetical protein